VVALQGTITGAAFDTTVAGYGRLGEATLDFGLVQKADNEGCCGA